MYRMRLNKISSLQQYSNVYFKTHSNSYTDNNTSWQLFNELLCADFKSSSNSANLTLPKSWHSNSHLPIQNTFDLVVIKTIAQHLLSIFPGPRDKSALGLN